LKEEMVLNLIKNTISLAYYTLELVKA